MQEILNRIKNLKNLLNIQKKEMRVKQIEEEMNSADFWLNESDSNTKTKELKNLQSEINEFNELHDLAHLAEEDDDIKMLEGKVNDLERLAFFKGKYDSHPVAINFYAGAGGDDAQDWTAMLMKMYLKWAEIKGHQTKIIDQSDGAIAGIKNATIEINGNYLYGLLKHESGVHRLVRQSPFNAKALRQTSFSLVEVLPLIESSREIEIEDRDLKIDTFRSSGRGGQGVNTTDSAVRITHIPTGIVATCQNERSQLQNKENALKVLRSRLALMLEAQNKEQINELRGSKTEIEWGSQIRSYILHPYKMVKDHRSGCESSEPEKVLNGDLDLFIDAEISWSHNIK